MIKVNFKQLRDRNLVKALIAIGLTTVCAHFVASHAYDAGVYETCRKIEENGFDPIKMLNPED